MRFGKAAGSLDQREVSRGDLGNGAGILGVEPILEHGDLRRVDRQRSGGERRDEVGQGEVDRDAGHAGGDQRLDRDGDDLARGGDGVEADQFAADLAQLARRRELRGAQLEHAAGIGQAHRARVMAHARRGDAADLRGDVGPDRQRALAHRIDEAHRIARAAGLEACGKAVLELGEGGVGALITISMRRAEHRRLEPCGGIGLWREPVLKAVGEQGVGHASFSLSLLCGERAGERGRAASASLIAASTASKFPITSPLLNRITQYPCRSRRAVRCASFAMASSLPWVSPSTSIISFRDLATKSTMARPFGFWRTNFVSSKRRARR